MLKESDDSEWWNIEIIWFLFVSCITKMTHHNLIFISMISLKCFKLENKGISNPICNLMLGVSPFVLTQIIISQGR